MPNEGIKRFILDNLRFIPEAAMNFNWIISIIMIINDLPVPVIYEDFPEMFKSALLFEMIALLFLMHVVIDVVIEVVFGFIVDCEQIFTRVYTWLCIMFFVLAICIYIIGAMLGLIRK